MGERPWQKSVGYARTPKWSSPAGTTATILCNAMQMKASMPSSRSLATSRRSKRSFNGFAARTRLQIPGLETKAGRHSHKNIPALLWGIYPSVIPEGAGVNCSMSYQTQELLKAIRVEGEHWQPAVHEQVEAGRNFFLIFPEGVDALVRFCHSFNLQPDCLKGRFSRSD